MKQTVHMGVKLPIPGINYSNLDTSITLESDEDNHDELVSSAVDKLSKQLSTLFEEAKELMT